MPATGGDPVRKFTELQFGGVLDESLSPRAVTAHGLTDCDNLIYRRWKSWGKRSGSGLAYQAQLAGAIQTPFTSGIRWYKAFPSPVTTLVVFSNGAMFTAQDPGVESLPHNLLRFIEFSGQYGKPIRFCSVRDPIDNNGLGQIGSDILIICGAVLPNDSYAKTHVTVGGTFGASAAGDSLTITLTLLDASTITTDPYIVLSTDNATTIAQALSDAVNNLITPGKDFVPSISNATQVIVAAAMAGVAGNGYKIQGTATGGHVTLTPSSATAFTGGGTGPSVGPLKFDGTALQPLSPFITQPFTGCVTWHDHVWYWGDPANPDTLFASDIDEPEGWTFMTEFGGYDIGVGDGDPGITAVVPIGNILYVFKSNTIYAITGYDFQSGDYQFQVQPAIQGRGTPSQECVATLRNSLIFWDGTQFERLAVGAFDTEHIGSPICLTSGQIAQNGAASLIRAVAGDFLVDTNLNDTYDAGNPAPTTQTLMSNIALFAVDFGDGKPDHVLVFDDDASAREGEYAWSIWTGWDVGFWVPFGHGPNSAGTVPAEPPQLFWIPPPGGLNPPQLMQFGQDPLQDSGAKQIHWMAQTGWHNFDVFALPRELHRIFLNLECTPYVQIAVRLTTVPFQDGSYGGAGALQDPTRELIFPLARPIDGSDGNESEQMLLVAVNRSASGPAGFLESYAFMFRFTEPGNSGPLQTASGAFELSAVVLDYLEQPWKP